MAFFHDGNIDAVIATLHCHLVAGEVPGYEPIIVRDHIRAKLAGSRYGKANTAATREATRVRDASGERPG